MFASFRQPLNPQPTTRASSFLLDRFLVSLITPLNWWPVNIITAMITIQVAFSFFLFHAPILPIVRLVGAVLNDSIGRDALPVPFTGLLIDGVFLYSFLYCSSRR